MLTLTGQLISRFTQAERIDKKTGEIYPASKKVQLMTQTSEKGGGIRSDLVTLKLPDNFDFKGKEGEEVTIPVSAFASNGRIQFFIPQS